MGRCCYVACVKRRWPVFRPHPLCPLCDACAHCVTQWLPRPSTPLGKCSPVFIIIFRFNLTVDAVLKGVVRVENLEDAAPYVEAVLQRVKPEYLVRHPVDLCDGKRQMVA